MRMTSLHSVGEVMPLYQNVIRPVEKCSVGFIHAQYTHSGSSGLLLQLRAFWQLERPLRQQLFHRLTMILVP